jgi:hypothetical protein
MQKQELLLGSAIHWKAVLFPFFGLSTAWSNVYLQSTQHQQLVTRAANTQTQTHTPEGPWFRDTLFWDRLPPKLDAGCLKQF